METIVKVARYLRVPRLLKLAGLYKPTVLALKKRNEMLWEWRAKRLYSQFIKKGNIAFDVGANRGTRTKVFKRLGAIVVAIDPQEHCVDILKREYGGNTHVFIEQVALGSKEGDVEMMIQDDANMLATLSEDFIKATERYAPTDKWNRDHIVMVKVNTLDNLILKYGMPSFCKIDVEGYEYEVLMGLSQPIRALSIEFQPILFEEIARNVKRLKELGFVEYNYSMGETMKLVLPRWVTSEELIKRMLSLLRDMNCGDIYAKR